jgi:GAF domain-containing protein
LLRFIVGGIEQAYERVQHTAEALSKTNRELQANRDVLQTQAYELERRTRYLTATADIARSTTALLNRGALVQRLITLLGERFDLNRLGIFLLDATGEWVEALVRAAFVAGDVQLVDTSLRFSVSGDSSIGRIMETGYAYIEMGACGEALSFDVAGLAPTRSEAMLALHTQNRTVGVLAMQSRRLDAFDESDLVALQALADLVAVAINNAQLFEQAQLSLDTERRARGELTQQAWQQLLFSQPDLGYFSDRLDTLPTSDSWRPEMEIAFEKAEPVVDDANQICLAIPVRVGGTVIGVVHGCKSKESGGWTSDEMALLDTLTAQLDAAVERARLYQETQRRAAREQLIGEVTAHMRETLDVDTVLQSAARELCGALDLAEVEVRLGTGPEPKKA